MSKKVISIAEMILQEFKDSIFAHDLEKSFTYHDGENIKIANSNKIKLDDEVIPHVLKKKMSPEDKKNLH